MLCLGREIFRFLFFFIIVYFVRFSDGFCFAALCSLRSNDETLECFCDVIVLDCVCSAGCGLSEMSPSALRAVARQPLRGTCRSRQLRPKGNLSKRVRLNAGGRKFSMIFTHIVIHFLKKLGNIVYVIKMNIC